MQSKKPIPPSKLMKENAMEFPMVECSTTIQSYPPQKLKVDFTEKDIELKDEVLEIEAYEKLYCKIDDKNR